MTDISEDRLTSDAALPAAAPRERSKHTAKRFAAESRFKYTGLACVLIAAGFLVLLLSTVIGNGIPAFTFNYLKMSVDLSQKAVNPDAPGDADYRSIINDGVKEALPFVSGRSDRRTARGLVSSGAPIILRQDVLDSPDVLGERRPMSIPLSDTADLYFKGSFGSLNNVTPGEDITIADNDGEITIQASETVFSQFVANAREALGQRAEQLQRRVVALQRSVDKQERIKAAAETVLADNQADQAAKTRAQSRLKGAAEALTGLQSQMNELDSRRSALSERAAATEGTETLTREYPSLFLTAGEGVIKITEAGVRTAKGEVLVPFADTGTLSAGSWALRTFDLPESERKISDKEIIWLEQLKNAGSIESGWNEIFFTRGASREAEMAGIWGAVVGSFLTLIVTLFLSFFIGIAAAIYLEEFAPKNWVTDIIEVNINNLAAVPSIVFGLLGLGILINGVSLGWFTLGGGFPRSAAVTGGTVLALMTLPTIIIASRAALKAVPPSIREAALGVGASKIQTVFHHVLPLAMPGMLTGTIIGMAQALGETAPLLMIGMVAFIVDIPGGPTDPATVLPVQIYMWADFPEQAFQQKTAAAIMVLLAFLVLMNAIAVILRKRFERRW